MLHLFLSDLDNTLIYSYKRDIGQNKILVEQKDGKELSFMTAYSLSLLEKLQKKVMLIPLTTRSTAQFERITFPKSMQPRLALTANGGILLMDGKRDEQWYDESLHLIERAVGQMEKGMNLLRKDPHVYYDVGYVDGLFVFTKSHAPSKTMDRLRQELDISRVSIHENGEKVYILPKALDKGVAVDRIRRRFEGAKIVSAGDSLFDIPMLLSADIGFFPKALTEHWQVSEYGETHQKSGLFSIEDHVFADALLQRLALFYTGANHPVNGLNLLHNKA